MPAKEDMPDGGDDLEDHFQPSHEWHPDNDLHSIEKDLLTGGPAVDRRLLILLETNMLSIRMASLVNVFIMTYQNWLHAHTELCDQIIAIKKEGSASQFHKPGAVYHQSEEILQN